MKIRKGSATYGALVMTGVNVIAQLIGFTYRIGLSRLIGAEGMGLYQLIFPVYSMTMSLIASGLYVAVSRLSAEYLAVGNNAAVHKLVLTAQRIFVALFLPVSAAIIIFSDFIGAEVLGDVRTQAGLILLVPCILLTGFENIFKNFFYGSKNVNPPAISEIIEQLVRTGAVLSLLYFLRPGHGEAVVAVIVFGMTVCEVVSSTMLRLFYRRDMKKRKIDAAAAPKMGVLADKMAKIAIPVMLTSLLGTLLGSANAILIPQRLAASGLDHQKALASFGVLFGMTLQLLNLPLAFMGALSLVMIPRLAESSALHNMQDVRRHISRTLYATSLLVLPAAALLIPLGPDLSVLLFNQPDAGAHFTLLTLDTAIGCYQMITGSILYSIGKQNRAAVNFLLGGAIQLVVTYYATAMPELRLAGFAIACLVGTILTLILNLFSLCRATGYKPELYRSFFLPALASFACMEWAGFVNRLPSLSAIVSSVAAALTGLLIYCGAMRLFGLRISNPFAGSGAQTRENGPRHAKPDP